MGTDAAQRKGRQIVQFLLNLRGSLLGFVPQPHRLRVMQFVSASDRLSQIQRRDWTGRILLAHRASIRRRQKPCPVVTAAIRGSDRRLRR